MKRKILVIDDEKGFTEMLRMNLEATGDYDVTVENDSMQAIETAIKIHPDLILLDVIMPNREGPDVLVDIRHNPQLNQTPVIFLTATVTEDEVSSQRGRIGGNTFIAKPSRLTSLLDSIEENLVLSRG